MSRDGEVGYTRKVKTQKRATTTRVRRETLARFAYVEPRDDADTLADLGISKKQFASERVSKGFVELFENGFATRCERAGTTSSAHAPARETGEIAMNEVEYHAVVSPWRRAKRAPAGWWWRIVRGEKALPWHGPYATRDEAAAAALAELQKLVKRAPRSPLAPSRPPPVSRKTRELAARVRATVQGATDEEPA